MKKWFMKNKVATMFTILTTMLMASVSFNVSAASSLVEIKANLNHGINVVLHGKKFEAVDPADGTKYVPITYKGRTYLPLRAVAEAAGLKVTWDNKTNTAILGNEEGEIVKETISWIKASPEYGGYGPRYLVKSRTPNLLTAGDGTVFEFGYFEENSAGQSETFKTNYEFDKFKARIWADDNKDEDGNYDYIDSVIRITDENDILVKEIKVEYGKMYDIEIDIKDVKELNVWVRGGKSIIGEPMLGK